jgi:hypothetical protein
METSLDQVEFTYLELENIFKPTKHKLLWNKNIFIVLNLLRKGKRLIIKEMYIISLKYRNNKPALLQSRFIIYTFVFHIPVIESIPNRQHTIHMKGSIILGACKDSIVQ